MTRWRTATSGVVLSLLAAGSTVRADAATTAVMVLQGSRTASVDITLSSATTFDVAAMTVTGSWRFVGFYVDAIGAAQSQPQVGNVGAVIPRDFHPPGAREGYTVPFWNRSDSGSTLEPGRYRFYLLTDGPGTVRVPLKAGRSMTLRPVRAATAALVSKQNILISPVEAKNVQPITVAGTRNVSFSALVLGKFRVFAGDIGACLRKPESQCGSATNGGMDGPFTGAAISPLEDADFGFVVTYSPGAIPPGRYEVWQGALNVGGLTYATGVAFTLSLT
ncbi:MAG: hypothetical protein ABIO67_06265 [Mycobacteriales bacterium]